MRGFSHRFGFRAPAARCLGALALALGLGASPGGAQQPQRLPADLEQRGLVSEPRRLERDATGRPIADGLPLVQPRRAPSAADAAALDPLKQERDRVLESARAARAVVELADPPHDELQAEIDAARRDEAER